MVKIIFHITGFSKFFGVDENPTEDLCKHLINDLKKQNNKNEKFLIESCSVLNVSAIDTIFYFKELEKKYIIPKKNLNEEVKIILLHFGVGGIDMDSFHIEKMGWNEADFSCPDEREWMPFKQTIIPTFKEDNISTTLPVLKIQEKLIEKGFKVSLSNDPGRFICNWTYFLSLYFSKENGTESLFIHVPPFEIFSFDIQLKFIKELLSVITNITNL